MHDKNVLFVLRAGYLEEVSGPKRITSHCMAEAKWFKLNNKQTKETLWWCNVTAQGDYKEKTQSRKLNTIKVTNENLPK